MPAAAFCENHSSDDAEPDSTMTILTLDVEVQQRPQSTLPLGLLSDSLSAFLRSANQLAAVLAPSVTFRADELATDPLLSAHVELVIVPDLDAHRATERETLDLRHSNFVFHLYRLNEADAEEEILDGEEELSAANHFMLPCKEFDGLWESLVFDSSLKNDLVSYASTALALSDSGVDPNLVTCNRIILLHGPPGTGKTSLCKALAQKLSIRLSHRYDFGQLIEINSHSLFSKWFSESGKLVMKMFRNVEEFIEDPKALVFLLIDEVESLTAARKAACSGNEPSDAIRVVNALLTQIDRVKRHPNVFVLTTSNLSGAIDLAFVDRADVKQFVGPPSPAAISAIYRSCLEELVARGLLGGGVGNVAPSWQALSPFMLDDVSRKSFGFSARTLRKLPFIALALFGGGGGRMTIEEFLQALEKAVERQLMERRNIADAV